MIPPLHISLLGEFLLISGDTPVTTVDWPRLHSLLAYLVLHHTVSQSRTHLAFLLWPDSTDAQAHANLRNLVYRLRRDLPYADYFLHADKQTLRWKPDAPWTLDVADFERAIAQAGQAQSNTEMRNALVTSVEMYHSDLLPGNYDEWILPERERLRQLFLRALERLILLLEQERDYLAAISYAQRLLRYDPLHEATYHHLMRLYDLNGERAAAIRAYHTCATVFNRELALEPSRATREVYEHFLQNDSPSVPPASPSAKLVTEVPLVGRQHEWAQLQLAWQNAVAGEPHLVILSGESGVGKTQLAEELLSWVGRQGMTTASARCYAPKVELAYAPVASWLRAEGIRTDLEALADVWLTEVARFVPDILTERPDLPHPGPLVGVWQRQHLFEALARAILGARQPLLLLLDDLQWCDRETLEWLHYLLGVHPHARVLIVGTLRPEEMAHKHPLAPLLTTLRSSRQVTEIRVAPLNALARFHYWMGRMHYYHNDPREALSYFRRVLAEAQEVGDEELIATSSSVIGRVLVHQGYFGQARQFLVQATSALERASKWTEYIDTIGYLGIVRSGSGEYRAGVEEIQRDLERHHLAADAICHCCFVIMYILGGGMLQALEESRALVSVGEQSDDQLAVYLGYGLRAWAEIRLGHHEEALAHMAQQQAIAKRLGEAGLILEDTFAALKAEIALKAGHTEQALALAEEAVAYAQAVDGKFAEGLAQRVWGQALVALSPPRWDAAKAHMAASLQAFEAGDIPLEVARTHQEWALLCRVHYDPLEALMHLEQAAAKFEACGLLEERERMRNVIVELEKTAHSTEDIATPLGEIWVDDNSSYVGV